MTKALLVSLLLLMCSCGNDPDPCKNTDTSQAPDRIVCGESTCTSFWGDCSRTYPKQ